MKPRARRIAFLTVAAGCLVVAGLVIFNWATVRDSLEAWHFLLTGGTRTIMPDPKLRARGRHLEETPFGLLWIDPQDLFGILADYSGVPVVLDAEHTTEGESLPGVDCERFTDVDALRILRAVGYRILDQRFPGRAYVVTGYPIPPFRFQDLSHLATENLHGPGIPDR